MRGLLARLEFFDSLAAQKITPKSKELREKLVAHKLGRISSKLGGYLQKKSKVIAEAVSQAGLMLQRHEDLMRGYAQNFEALVRRRYEAQQEAFEQYVDQKLESEVHPSTTGENKWAMAKNLAKARLGEDCSICLSELGGSKPLMFTSCGHLFHAACLLAFEQFAHEKSGTCPNCRHPFAKLPFVRQAET